MAHEHERGRIKQSVFRQSLLSTLGKNGFLPELSGRGQRPFIPGVIHETTARGMVVSSLRGKIRKFHGHPALGDGTGCQRQQGRPGSSFVNVLIHWLSVPEAFHDAGKHHKVHTAVTAHFRGQLPDAFPEGMIVFFINSGQFFPAFNPFMIIAVAQLFTRHAGWETGQRALRSLDQVGAGVRPGGCLIQLDKNGPPQLRLDNSRIHVTADEWSIVPAVISGKMLLA